MEAALWAIIFLCFSSSAIALLSPKGVNFEGTTIYPRVILFLFLEGLYSRKNLDIGFV